MAESIRVSAGFTRNLGNFESFKVQYDIESDERREEESIDDFHNRLKAKVHGWIIEDIEENDAEQKG